MGASSRLFRDLIGGLAPMGRSYEAGSQRGWIDCLYIVPRWMKGARS